VLAEITVQPEDIALGLSTNNKDTTAEQVRAGAKVGAWSQQAFLQSMEFDNAGGVRHNAAGNLLSLNFGTSGAGGQLYNLSTNGNDPAGVVQLVFAFDGNSYGLSKTRVTGLSVSPDNQHVAVFGSDSSALVVLAYDAGGYIGEGSGASVTSGWQTTIGTTGISQGSTWYDDDTILAYVVEGSVTKLYSIDFDGGSFSAPVERATIEPKNGVGSGGRFAEVEYNPEVAPYVLCSYGHFTSSVVNNTLTIVDPADWSLVKTLDLSTSMGTAREISLAPDLRLYFSENATASGPHIDALTLDTDGDGDIDADDIAALTDNSTTDYYSATVASNFNGLDAAFGTIAASGACCLGGEECVVTTESDCGEQGGEYKGDGTNCDNPEICVPPTGACCTPLGGCQELTEEECAAQDGEYLGDLTTCTADICPVTPQPVEPGDVAFGLSNADPSVTAEHIRDGSKIGLWSSQPFVQMTEFDNAGGALHNADGNLLALNFGIAPTGGCADEGRPDEGGKVYNLATDGSDQGELIYEFDTRRGGIACTRIGGLGVSTDNTLISMIGYDTGNLYVLEYDAGAAIGTGQGASITEAFEWTGQDRDSFTRANATQGTAWFDDRTVLCHVLDLNGAPGVSKLWTIDFDPDSGEFSETERATLYNIGGGSRYMDVEYNPNLAPFVFCMYSSFASGVTNNSLTVIDPADWSEVKFVTFSSGDPISMQTAREIALGPDLKLYVAQFSSLIDTIDMDLDDDGDIDADDMALLTDDSSVDYYASGTFASFTGIDVAVASAAEPCAGFVRGDSNGDGGVDFNDIDCFVAALIGPDSWADCGTQAPPEGYVCLNDIDQNGSVDFDDIDGFVECLINQGCP
jgi:hypothetical protein